jgi:choice-of-anchor A domain-containing protein
MQRIVGWSMGVLMLAGVLASAAQAQCPQNLCDCLGAAGQYSLVGDQVQIKSGKISVSGYGYAIPSGVEGSVCMNLGKVGGKASGETDVSEDLLFAAGPGTLAGKFKGYKYSGYAYAGAFIGGDVATGGGSLAGTEYVEVSGITDTSGGYSEISSCTGALVDVATASATLAALPATQTFDDIVVTDAGTFTITGVAGVNVVNVASINLKPQVYYGYATGSVLEIDLPGLSDTMIINVAESLQVGNNSAIFVVNGAPENVIINVHGGLASKVKVLGQEAAIDPAILAPGAKVITKGDSYLSNILGGYKSKIAGAQIGDILLCP